MITASPRLSRTNGSLIGFPATAVSRIFRQVIIPATDDLPHIVGSLPGFAWSIRPGRKNTLTIGMILAKLVRAYDQSGDSRFYNITGREKINGHFGLECLEHLVRHWEKIPRRLRDWACGKQLLGMADTILVQTGNYQVPFLNCRHLATVPKPVVDWIGVEKPWDHLMFGLRMRVPRT
jgi:hypothetical protein